MKKVLCILLSVIFSLVTLEITPLCLVLNTGNYAEISIEADFSEERILVVLSNEASLNSKSISQNDLKSIGINKVSDISTASGNLVRSAKENITNHVLNGEKLLPYNGIPLGEYHQILCLELDEPGKENVINVIKEVQKNEDVLYVCPDYKLKKCETTPNDEYYLEFQNADAEIIGLKKAWNICTGLSNNYSSAETVIVGILDTGIDEYHNDLAGNINSTLCRDFSQYTKKGILACQHKDYDGHGTMCAGIIGAVGNNQSGIAGVCWNIEMVSLRISEEGEAYSSNVIAAINYAQQTGIDVLNLSYGWASHKNNMNRYNPPLILAISNYSGVFVCSAGNESKDIDDDAHYPSEHNTANMITVGASLGETIADFSNFGAETVELFAPGKYIYSTFTSELCNESGCSGDDDETDCIHTNYHKSSGTSFAAPYVAGTAALLLCINRNLSSYSIKDAIMNSVDKRDENNNFEGKCVSNGRLNVFKAIMEITDHSNHIKSYSNSTASTHTVTCSTCDYTYSEAHIQYSAVPNTSTTSHTATCFACGYSGSFPHEWSDMITFYKCMICGKTTTAAPEIMLVSVPPNKDEEVITE